MNRYINYLYILCVGGLLQVLSVSCDQDIQVGNLAVDMKYKDQKQSVVTGLDARVGEFVFSKSSLPLTFEIEGVFEEDGASTAELSEIIKVPIFTEAVSSDDSEEMRVQKRDTVLLPAVEIEKHTGVFVVHGGNNIKEGKYHFNVKVTNVSGNVVLNDVFILEVLPHYLFSFSNFGGTPTIVRVADTPHQIVFKAYNAQTNEAIPAENFHFMDGRENGFKGIFAGDTSEGELWNVAFPVKPADTQLDIEGQRMYMDFALGIPGKYEIKLYK